MAKAFMAVSSVSPSKEPKPSSMNSESSRTAPEWFCTTSESPKARDKEAKNCSPPERVSMERGSIEGPVQHLQIQAAVAPGGGAVLQPQGVPSPG